MLQLTSWISITLSVSLVLLDKPSVLRFNATCNIRVASRSATK